MTEQLISFETAKLAKERGFFIEGSRNFIHDNHAGTSSYGITKKQTEEVIKLKYFNAAQLLLYPTQSFLQKWLREKHKIFCNSGAYTELGTNLDKNSYPNGFRGVVYPYQALQVQDTYEQALEVALFEALKLIK